MKRVVVAILGVLVSILVNPLALAADDHFLPRAPHLYEHSAQAAETDSAGGAWPSKLELASTALTNDGLVSALAKPVANLMPAQAANPAASGAAAGGVAASYNISITYHSRDQYTSTSQNLSFGDIYRFEKLVYAHNTAALFGNLGSLTPGSVFTLSEGGATRTYRVAAQAVYANTPDGLDGDYWLMEDIVYSALGHSVALMTCAGTPYGNGNATQRLVVYGDEI